MEARRDNLDAAIAIFEETLEMQRKALGDRHGATLDTMGELGNALFKNKNFDAAEKLLRQMWQTCQSAYGQHHRTTVGAAILLGASLKHRANAMTLNRSIAVRLTASSRAMNGATG